MNIAMPSFLSGMARAFDLFGLFDSCESLDGSEADARAIASDWRIVGQDIYSAIEQFEKLK